MDSDRDQGNACMERGANGLWMAFGVPKGAKHQKK